MERTAVVLDEHPLWLDAVEAVLARLQVKVEGKTTSVARTLELVDTYRPDVLLLEPTDNSGDGRRLDLMRRAREIHPGLKVIVLSNSHEASAVDAVVRAIFDRAENYLLGVGPLRTVAEAVVRGLAS